MSILTSYLVVDGSWSEWGKWSSCSVNCLGERKKTRTRTRTCSNPAPLGGGRDYSGENSATEICGNDAPICFCVRVLSEVCFVCRCTQLESF